MLFHLLLGKSQRYQQLSLSYVLGFLYDWEEEQHQKSFIVGQEVGLNIMVHILQDLHPTLTFQILQLISYKPLQFPIIHNIFNLNTSSPVRNIRISPGSSYWCIFIQVQIAASKQDFSGVQVKNISTGNIRPGISNRGAPSKYFQNFSASIVALMTTTWRSVGLFCMTSLSSPNRMSVFNVLSWASSSMMTPYLSSSGS